jgi:hypothetical protein
MSEVQQLIEEGKKAFQGAFDEEALTEEEAAAFYKVKPQTMAKWRMNRVGPSYFRLGHKRGTIRYFKSDLIRSAKENEMRSVA